VATRNFSRPRFVHIPSTRAAPEARAEHASKPLFRSDGMALEGEAPRARPRRERRGAAVTLAHPSNSANTKLVAQSSGREARPAREQACRVGGQATPTSAIVLRSRTVSVAVGRCGGACSGVRAAVRRRLQTGASDCRGRRGSPGPARPASWSVRLARRRGRLAWRRGRLAWRRGRLARRDRGGVQPLHLPETAAPPRVVFVRFVFPRVPAFSLVFPRVPSFSLQEPSP